MSKSSTGLFKSHKPIRLGVWGLGRGSSFYASAKAIGYEIVAGCDFNEHMRKDFLQKNPDAWVTEDSSKFLAGDFDAVLLATFCPAHADDAIACLTAGKHVLSEVTSYHTMAEGVRLVEAVEKSGKVYNLAENYPFTQANHWLANKWRTGLFGELAYAEYEYVHECRELAYTYIDGTPINPGWQAHSWRSWLNGHYYNTHSLGPMMHISGLRPTRVAALGSTVGICGYPARNLEIKKFGGIASSLIEMSNGSVVRNLMGATTNDVHTQRIWGTKGAAEIHDGALKLRLGGSGHSPKFDVTPRWDELSDVAISAGHGGGDFWVLYYFAREILEGIPAPFTIYSAADCTSAGILALRSTLDGGKPQVIPDFREKSQRDAYRNDDWKQNRFDHVNGLFPQGHDTNLTSKFSLTMRDLIKHATDYRALVDWHKVEGAMKNPRQLGLLLQKIENNVPHLQETYKTARQIADAYPTSVAARVLNEMLEHGLEKEVVARDFAKRIKKYVSSPKKVTADAASAPKFVSQWNITPSLAKRPKGGVATVAAIDTSKPAQWIPKGFDHAGDGFVNLHLNYGAGDGIAYVMNHFYVDEAATYNICLGNDGGARVFVNGKPIFGDNTRQNPAKIDRHVIPAKFKKGKNTLLIAFDTENGQGWGFYFRFAAPKGKSKLALPGVII